ncbi:hypothetical protein CLAFUW4_14412 [Fulvia fulva]|uniref:BTB domain-containing protein n=1 Tax=Passalora fulva TaxID=5499 RepID=A0A9Q8PMR8_PASFU|nr:uncharacterized protein CLAFUR5_14244 [Fulvia fulva]KAK4609832.1 hypothetical protein CLAFUR0_14412 [Fulvia fulva]UJO25295.1 hypothetical protein CLAFUR5_14244 [Fulvia fulva]WPV22659.1 hypothetical protein CLAFUW4_14412 [Fulvia fulva]
MTEVFKNLKRKVESDEDRVNKLVKLAKLKPTTAIVVKFNDNTKDSRIVHRQIVCSHSPCIKRLVPARISYDDYQIVDLRFHEITPTQFDVYVDWVYAQQTVALDGAIALLADEQAPKDCKMAEHIDHRTMHVLADLWNVGGKLQDSDFQREIIKAICRVPIESRVSATKCKVLRGVMLGGTSAKSTLRRVCLDLMEHRIASVEDAELKTWTKDVVIDLMKRSAARAEVPVPVAEMYVEPVAAPVAETS